MLADEGGRVVAKGAGRLIPVAGGAGDTWD